MSLPPAPLASTLATTIDGWAPDAMHTTRRVDPWPAAAFGDLLDAPPQDPGDPLPPLWHWFTLLG